MPPCPLQCKEVFNLRSYQLGGLSVEMAPSKGRSKDGTTQTYLLTDVKAKARQVRGVCYPRSISGQFVSSGLAMGACRLQGKACLLGSGEKRAGRGRCGIGRQSLSGFDSLGLVLERHGAWGRQELPLPEDLPTPVVCSPLPAQVSK